MQARNCTVEQREKCTTKMAASVREREVDLRIDRLQWSEVLNHLFTYIAVTRINWLYSCRAFSAQLSSFDVLYSRPTISSGCISMSSASSFFILSIICRFLLFLLPYSLPWKSLFKLQKSFSALFLNKLIFNSFSSFRLRAGFDAGVMERFLFFFPSSFQMLILTAPKRRKKKNVFFGK